MSEAEGGARHPSPALTAPPTPINERALLFTLAGIQFTYIVDFMVMMPLGPQFTRLFGITDAQFGLLVSSYTFSAGISGLLGSTFVDRFERKRLLLWLYVAFALATLACGLAPTYALLMMARIAAGLFGGVMGTLVQTMVGDVVPFERRGRAMGIVMAAFSLSTIAGVPASLWLADRLGWNAPFVAIAAASLVIAAVGVRTLPRLAGHLQEAGTFSPWRPIADVLRDRNHWHAFGFTALIMSASFTVIPFLTIYMTSNMGLQPAQVPLVYLAGGLATFFSARLFGVLSDRWGKVQTFRFVAAVAMVTMLVATHMGDVPLWALLSVTTLFFVFVSGRMVPGMALVTAAAAPALRGTFMSLNGSVQSAAMGVASLVGGLLIGRDSLGRVTGYDWCGWVAVALSVLSIWAVGRLKVSSAAPGAGRPAAA
ncbi:MFS transporter [Piscinibacter sp.]|uniref:MFS transporter n=1 Tax=Piscinibacter sp. TaxID=1903157 RepID=UPI002BFBBB0A|nr:MFS transporter [Albitalea sp.]HUG22033.1 MFS transporter [Albitalea sp.]